MHTYSESSITKIMQITKLTNFWLTKIENYVNAYYKGRFFEFCDNHISSSIRELVIKKRIGMSIQIKYIKIFLIR